MALPLLHSWCTRKFLTPRRRAGLGVALLAVLSIGGGLAVDADSPRHARIVGHVTGERQAPLSGARITLSATESPTTLTRTTEATGAFLFDQVPSGYYRVAVSYHDIGGASDEPLLFEAGETYTLDLPMAVTADVADGPS